MRKGIGVLGILLLVGLVGNASAQELPKTINIGTHSVGAFFHVIGSAEGSIISKYTPMKTKVKPIGISSWMPGMLTGEIDMGVLNSTDARWGYFGEDQYEAMSQGKGFPIRLLLTGICNDVSVLVSGKSKARKSSELKGLTIAAGFTKAPACQLQTSAVLANGGLSWDDVKVVPVAAPPPAVTAVKEGRADAAGTATTGMPSVEELAAKKGGYFIKLDPSSEAKARAMEAYPDAWLQLIEDGAYPGIHGDTWMLRYEIYTVVRENMSDEAVKTILHAMWDNNDKLPSHHKKFSEWTPETYASKKLTIPYHPAAVEFLKEKDLWTDELETRQKELLSAK